LLGSWFEYPPTGLYFIEEITLKTAELMIDKVTIKTSLTEGERWNRKLKCRELGDATERAANATAANVEHRNPRAGYTLLAPEYCFNETLNTCIYEEGFIPGSLSAGGDGPHSYHHMSVTDLLTGRVLLDGYLPLGEPENDNQRKTQEEYKRKREAIFAGCVK
jgi:hypothetical protein